MTSVVEPLTLPIPGGNPYTMHPIVHSDIWDTYKKMQSMRWFVEELKLDQDIKCWVQLSEGEQFFIKTVLGFFAASDGIVSANLVERFMQDTAWATVKAVYAEQLAMEQVHSETYSVLIDKYISDQAEKTRLFNAIETIPAVRGKAEWALKWINDMSASFAQRMVAFAIVEGVFFAGSFCAIFWLREQGKMPGLTEANTFIARDEGMHTDFACLLYTRYIKNKLSDDVVASMMRDAVEIEDEFINKAIPCKLVGMNSDAMREYIRYMADRITMQLGHKPVFNATNPFPFMARAGAIERVNFFEARNTEYSRAVTSIANFNANAISGIISDDF